MRLQAVVNKINRLNINTLMRSALTKLEPQMADLNVNQLEEGKTSENKLIKPKYSAKYGQFKKRIGSKSSPTPDLKLTGKFHEGIFADTKQDSVEFGSTDKKEGFLENKYDDIFTLNRSSIKELKPALLMELRKELRRIV